jgi:hypothetical protein
MKDLSAHRPSLRATDLPDIEEDCRPKRPTPRTNHAKDHHAARLIDTLHRSTSGSSATTKRSWPVRIRYVTGS